MYLVVLCLAPWTMSGQSDLIRLTIVTVEELTCFAILEGLHEKLLLLLFEFNSFQEESVLTKILTSIFN